MNGLKYIRTCCNLSLKDLAGEIGVSRQALSSWENGTKKIPKSREDQLSEFLGIDKKYFGKISEEDIKYILELPMERNDVQSKEAYKFKEDYSNHDHCYYYDGDELSLSERYIVAKNREKELINRINKLMTIDKADYIQDRIMQINRNCTVYEMITLMLETRYAMPRRLKVPFHYELLNVWKSMLLAYGIKDFESLEIYNPPYSNIEGADKKWVIGLAKQLEQHWLDTQIIIDDHFDKLKKKGL